MANNVCLLIVTMVTDGDGKSCMEAVVYEHADAYRDISPILAKWPHRLIARVCPSLARAKVFAQAEGVSWHAIRVIQAGQG